MNKDNYCVIMSGGIGSRFWPASRESKPKQFLDFFGMGKTLLRMTFERFNSFIPTSNIYVVTSEKYKDMTLAELPELPEDNILLEPMRRNTAPCIAYASYRIQALNPNANIVIAPSDHLIIDESRFVETIKTGLEFTKSQEALLTLGIHPTRPETGYGYIQVNENEEEGFVGVHKVKVFTEKPNLDLAKSFIESGEFLWNSGIFLWSVNTIIKAFRANLHEVSSIFDRGIDVFGTNDEQEFIDNIYSYSPSISIDFGVLEKADNVYVLGADFGWSDVGTWGSLYDLSEKDEECNVVVNNNALLYDSKNNVISLDKEKLVVAQGLDGYIVVESQGVLLICKKEQEQRIRDFVEEVKIKYDNKYI